MVGPGPFAGIKATFQTCCWGWCGPRWLGRRKSGLGGARGAAVAASNAKDAVAAQPEKAQGPNSKSERILKGGPARIAHRSDGRWCRVASLHAIERG